MQNEKRPDLQNLLAVSLAAFIHAGTIDLSLDRLAESVGVSKRMLIHYFGGREEIEERAMTLLEDRLRQQFAPETFPPSTSLAVVVDALWSRTTAPESRGVLLLIMDLSRRAWNGSARAKSFYAEQQRLWIELLLRFSPNKAFVEDLLQLFQGAVLAYLITGDSDAGRRSLTRFFSNE
jgi:AcrR family transcriptional regulator